MSFMVVDALLLEYLHRLCLVPSSFEELVVGRWVPVDFPRTAPTNYDGLFKQNYIADTQVFRRRGSCGLVDGKAHRRWL